MTPALESYAEHAAAMRVFADEHIVPFAHRIDQEQQIPREVVERMREAGLFASGFPERLGGTPGSKADPVSATVRHGMIHEALGRASPSVQGLLNVHHMGGSAILRWGTQAQKGEWGQRLSSGEVIAAFAITEPEVGSDASAIQTTAVPVGDGWEVSGTKTWITCGQSADIFVMLTQSERGPLAVILPRDTPGLRIEPILGILGCRGYMLATLYMERCAVPPERVLGQPGFGLSHVVAEGLDNGRHNLAWGCVGLGQACLDASLHHAAQREQFGGPIGEFGQIQRLLARMMTDVHAARLVCWSAAVARGRRDPSAVQESFMAKYLASTMTNRVAADAVQVHGASGVGPGSPVETAFRDARIMELIEGTTQIVERAIARFGLQGR